MRESITTNLLNHHNPNNSLATRQSLYPWTKHGLHPSSRKLLFQQMEPPQKTTANQNAELSSPVPVNASTTHTRTQGSGTMVDEGWEDCKSQGLVCCETVLAMSEVT